MTDKALETLLRPVVENALLAADMAGETYGSKASRITEKVIEALNTCKPCDAGLVERVAEAICERGHKDDPDPRWPTLSDEVREYWREYARAAIASIHDQGDSSQKKNINENT